MLWNQERKIMSTLLCVSVLLQVVVCKWAEMGSFKEEGSPGEEQCRGQTWCV